MLVFISWSGRRSKAVAEALQSWLSQVIQAVEPWLSADLEKGVRWGPEITSKLEKSRFGIICLTRENLNNRWIQYEAGAISRAKGAHVCTFLLDLAHSDVEQPLAQFNHTLVTEEDILRLTKTINSIVKKAKEKGLDDAVLAKVFATNWPRLEADLSAARTLEPEDVVGKVRTTEELVRETLEIARIQESRLSNVESNILALGQLIEQFQSNVPDCHDFGALTDAVESLERRLGRISEPDATDDLFDLMASMPRQEGPGGKD